LTCYLNRAFLGSSLETFVAKDEGRLEAAGIEDGDALVVTTETGDGDGLGMTGTEKGEDTGTDDGTGSKDGPSE